MTAVLTWTLALQHSTSRTEINYALAISTEEEALAVESALAAATPGSFVRVAVRFTNLPDVTNVYLQPHEYGMWRIVQRAFLPMDFVGGNLPTQ